MRGRRRGAAWRAPSSPRLAATGSTPSTTTSAPPLRYAIAAGDGRHGARAGRAAVALLGDARRLVRRARAASRSALALGGGTARDPAAGRERRRHPGRRAGRLRGRPRLLRGEPGARPRDSATANARPAIGATTSASSPSTRGDFDTADRAATRRRRSSRASSATSARVSLDDPEPRDRLRRAGQPEEAIALLEESLKLARACGRPRAPELDERVARARAARRTTASARSHCCAPAWRCSHEHRRHLRLARCLETAAALSAQRPARRRPAVGRRRRSCDARRARSASPTRRRSPRRSRADAARGARRCGLRGRGGRGRRDADRAGGQAGAGDVTSARRG